MDSNEKKINKILGENLDKKKFSFFLFGSRARKKGKVRNNSDYDIGILGKNKLEFKKYLRLKSKLNEQINWPVDLVDFNRTGNDFKNLALKNIKLWNKGENIELIEKN